jgi:ubiquinone biosynthesis protein UbiJ
MTEPAEPDKQAAPSLPETAAIGLLNHILRRESWATARLRPFAGRTVRLAGGPLGISFTIQENGEVAQATGATIDAELVLTTGGLLAWLSSGETRHDIARIEGDHDLGMEVGKVLGQLRWDVEEDLSRVFGDVAAHRMVAAGNRLLSWQRDAALSLVRSLAEYWTEEQPLLAKPLAVRRFMHEVDDMRDAVERLEKRIWILERPAGDKQLQ